MKQFIKKFKAEILITCGAGLFSYNILNFRHGSYQGSYYYYPDGTLWGISIGIILITIGVLIIRNK
ncbi:MAG: hypothetical protein A2731_03315 [Candidatus Buchananbacteria bacterium RIFCSPHIGHO2_01_FULL_39_8]|uniref:Uncharacterized protein n=1 Tax=Candidatus Buchananbacteria bacterium RIFCSPHIGHO2_01_FULL_39_8 TaxID=1797533 RepID=A0A1G1XW04_9BACT|nr:MAG: hypothetical protein A2731_03315 [Candidatus Buchananbacteria bacterium RIFCSPHIGHO2_01_FULL_39_8]